MRVVVLHNKVTAADSTADADVLVQRDAVLESLSRLRHQAVALECTLDLLALKRQLSALRPELVFNLVESLDGTDRLMPVVPLLLESLRLPYTGCPAAAIVATNDKPACKRQLAAGGIDTPQWVTRDSHVSELAGRYIIKPIAEHASRGLDDSSIVTPLSFSELQAEIEARDAAVSVPHFAEQFIDGRELNVSLLETVAGQPQVLPIAEIDFVDWPADRPRIVGQAAKWDVDSAEFIGTPRRFLSAGGDTALIARVSAIAMDCWHLLGLRGYARVDFRVDASGRPWVLELNTNPCLTADAGYAAALAEARLPFDDAIGRLLDAARGAASLALA